ncbi:colicin E3/pyocin S6 family cytotoxin [Lysinibacillus cavernae]|uniref:colicin E3/pyocin S6 family cytotoxin n=1 Tax=Lysinibacillus cavernae TaxID=2666135 RepID=UPI0012D8FE46|nr:colicin E3/pyocin S6 family cytotoxin [Lysinibacillus cavernae]
MVHKVIPKPSFLDTCIYVKTLGNHKLWRSIDAKRYYTWDTLHGEIEVFNKRGKHIGAADVLTGEFTKPAVRGRKIDV